MFTMLTISISENVLLSNVGQGYITNTLQSYIKTTLQVHILLVISFSRSSNGLVTNYGDGVLQNKRGRHK